MSTIKIHIMHTGQVRVAPDLPFWWGAHQSPKGVWFLDAS